MTQYTYIGTFSMYTTQKENTQNLQDLTRKYKNGLTRCSP